jgi:hypothetical protein
MTRITSTGAIRPPIVRPGTTGPRQVTGGRTPPRVDRPPVFAQGGQRLELGMTGRDRERVARGEHLTDWRLSETIATAAPVDRHRHRQASVKKLSGRDPTVVRRWLTALQRENVDFMVVLDAVLEGNTTSEAYQAVRRLSDSAPRVPSPWGRLTLLDAANAAAQTLKMIPGPGQPSIHRRTWHTE